MPGSSNFCPHCGKPVAADDQFCQECGRQLQGDPVPPPPPPPAPPPPPPSPVHKPQPPAQRRVAGRASPARSIVPVGGWIMLTGAVLLVLAEIQRFVSVQFRGAEDFVSTVIFTFFALAGALWSLRAEKVGKKAGALIFCTIIAILSLFGLMSSASSALSLRTDEMLEPYLQEKPFLRIELVLRSLVNAGAYFLIVLGYFIFLFSRKK